MCGKWLNSQFSVFLEVKVLSEHRGPVRSLVVLQDGRLVSGSSDQTIKFWDLCLTSSSCSITIRTESTTCLIEETDGLLLSGCENTFKNQNYLIS